MGIYLSPNNRMFQMMNDGDIYVDKTGIVSFMNRCIWRFVAVPPSALRQELRRRHAGGLLRPRLRQPCATMD